MKYKICLSQCRVVLYSYHLVHINQKNARGKVLIHGLIRRNGHHLGEPELTGKERRIVKFNHTLVIVLGKNRATNNIPWDKIAGKDLMI